MTTHTTERAMNGSEWCLIRDEYAQAGIVVDSTFTNQTMVIDRVPMRSDNGPSKNIRNRYQVIVGDPETSLTHLFRSRRQAVEFAKWTRKPEPK